MESDRSKERFLELLGEALRAHEEGGSAGLDALLAAHPEHADDLRAHVSGLVRMGMAGGSGAPAQLPERLGDFVLGSRLGSGGMGVVHRAQDPVLKREVALKLVRPELLWFPQSRERFRREVEAVAKLQHPGIVRVYSAGEEQGLPYYTMELIRGVSLAQLVEAFGSVVPEALDDRALRATLARWVGGDEGLFEATGRAFWEVVTQWGVALAEALAFAHGRGVLHRDLKPSNVMVGADGRVQILDFGLASTRSDQRLTRTGSQLGSLPYMSPEQFRTDSSVVDERSEIYSLGVTLYELCGLRNPFWEPGQGDERTRTRVLEGRAAPLRSACRTVPRDLEVVLAKAMDLEPARRYASMEDFGRDLGNVLAHRPVQARPPSNWIKLQRFAERRPATSVASVLGFLLVVVTPAGIAFREHYVAENIAAAMAAAQDQAEVREAILEFLDDDLLSAAVPGAAGRDASMREVLDRAAQNIEGRFPGRPLVEASVRVTLGHTYRSLDVLDRAEEHLVPAYDILVRELGEEHQDTLAAATKLAQLRNAQDRVAEAEEIYRCTLAAQRRSLGADAKDTLTTANNLGLLLARRRQFEEAETLLRDTYERRVRILGERHRHTLTTMSNLGYLYRLWHHTDQAVEWTERELAACRQVLGAEHPDTLTSLNNWAVLLGELGRDDEALAAMREVLSGREVAYGETHQSTLDARWNLAVTLLNRGRTAEARETLRPILALSGGPRGGDEIVLRCVHAVAHSHRLENHFDTAIELLEPALEEARNTLGDTHDTTFELEMELACCYDENGEVATGLEVLEEAIELSKDHLAEDRLAESRLHLARMLRKDDRTDEAEESLQTALEWTSAHLPQSRALHRELLAEFVRLSTALGRDEDALRWREEFRRFPVSTDDGSR